MVTVLTRIGGVDQSQARYRTQKKYIDRSYHFHSGHLTYKLDTF